MRIWLDPAAGPPFAHPRRRPGRPREQNIQVASGVIGQPPCRPCEDFQLTVNTLGRLWDPDQFKQIILKTGHDGRIVRIGDVARIELGAPDYTVNSYLNNCPPSPWSLPAFRPGANALATSDGVEMTMEELSQNFPQGHGVSYRLQSDHLRPRVDRIGQAHLFEAVSWW